MTGVAWDPPSTVEHGMAGRWSGPPSPYPLAQYSAGGGVLVKGPGGGAEACR